MVSSLWILSIFHWLQYVYEIECVCLTDIKGVEYVVNYDLPKSIDEYVHRIGRTGRVGNRGKATSFYDSEIDSPLAPQLVKILQQAGQEVPEWLDAGCYGGGGFSSGKTFGARDYRKVSILCMMV